MLLLLLLLLVLRLLLLLLVRLLVGQGCLVLALTLLLRRQVLVVPQNALSQQRHINAAVGLPWADETS
jgi:hypothetical protein